MDEDMELRGARGMVNKQNNCYLNALLQVVSKCEVFMEELNAGHKHFPGAAKLQQAGKAFNETGKKT
jgi:ubiquitin C-terminal hydrolase